MCSWKTIMEKEIPKINFILPQNKKEQNVFECFYEII